MNYWINLIIFNKDPHDTQIIEENMFLNKQYHVVVVFFPTNWDKHLFFTKELNDTQTFVQRNMVFFFNK